MRGLFSVAQTPRTSALSQVPWPVARLSKPPLPTNACVGKTRLTMDNKTKSRKVTSWLSRLDKGKKQCDNTKYSGLRWVDRHGGILKPYIAVVTGGRGTKVSFIVKFIRRIYQIWEFESEHQNQNTNKIKYSKYLKHNNTIQTVVWLYFRYLSLNHPVNNLSVKLDDVIHGNDIIAFDVTVMVNFNPITVAITTNRKTEIMVFIRRIIPKWW